MKYYVEWNFKGEYGKNFIEVFDSKEDRDAFVRMQWGVLSIRGMWYTK